MSIISVSAALKQINSILDDVKREVDTGYILSSIDTEMLRSLSLKTKELRDDYILANPERSGVSLAMELGISRARVSQIRNKTRHL